MKIFESTPCKHPVIILKDVQSNDMEALLSYMYDGIVSVAQSNLPQLIKAAELLQIKGLAVPDELPSRKRQYSVEGCCSPYPKRTKQQGFQGDMQGELQSPHTLGSEEDRQECEVHQEAERISQETLGRNKDHSCFRDDASESEAHVEVCGLLVAL